MLILPILACTLLAVQDPAPTPERLPAPTGPHATGRASFHWKDASRTEIETSAPDDRRELMVHLFYPADPKADAPRAAYMPDIDALRGVWRDAQVDQVAGLRAFSREGVPVVAGGARFPVIVLLPGGGMKGLTYHTVAEDLASHGWVVAALDPPYNARRVRFPDGRVLGIREPSERGWPEPRSEEEHRRFYRERVVHWSKDVGFVIDQLVVLDRESGPFKDRLDLGRGVGVAGHSRGGQAAGTVRLLDERVRGGINMDGMMREMVFQPVKGNDVSGAQPFLWLRKRLDPPPTDEQLKRAGRTRAQFETEFAEVTSEWDRRLSAVSGGALCVTLDRPGITHIDFSDEPLWDASLSPEERRRKLDTIADVRAWVRAFFDGTVRGTWTDLERLAREAGTTKPEVAARVYRKPWP